MACGNANPVKIVLINTQYVETDTMSFKSVVQRLTGKDSKIEVESKAGGRGFRSRDEKPPVGGGGISTSVLTRGVSFKEFDKLLMELPPLDELYQLWSN